MPKATLEFCLPDEEGEFQRTVKADDYCFALGDIARWMRTKLKHGGLSAETDAMLDEIWKQFHEILQSYDIGDEIY